VGLVVGRVSLGVGRRVGNLDGALVIVCDGTRVGDFVGTFEGFRVGEREGSFVGTCVVGNRVGERVGTLVGILEGVFEGILVGTRVGTLVGTLVGIAIKILSSSITLLATTDTNNPCSAGLSSDFVEATSNAAMDSALVDDNSTPSSATTQKAQRTRIPRIEPVPLQTPPALEPRGALDRTLVDGAPVGDAWSVGCSISTISMGFCAQLLFSALILINPKL
jgi:hypothetical protein